LSGPPAGKLLRRVLRQKDQEAVAAKKSAV
jgi:hypothetical protein